MIPVIKMYKDEYLEVCAGLMMSAYNDEPWHNRWTMETATTYLLELVDHRRFVGFTVWKEDKLIGAAFCHEKTWWNNDELFIDEFYIAPQHQRQGYGKKLFQSIEQYIREKSLEGITLLTNARMPTTRFYQKNGLAAAEQIIFMYKKI